MPCDDLRHRLEDLRHSLTGLINGRGGTLVVPPFRFRGTDEELCDYIDTLAALTGDESLCLRVGAVTEEVRQRDEGVAA